MLADDTALASASNRSAKEAADSYDTITENDSWYERIIKVLQRFYARSGPAVVEGCLNQAMGRTNGKLMLFLSRSAC